MPATIAIFALSVIVFVGLSARAGRVYVSAPMVFLLAGFTLSSTGFYDLGPGSIKAVAEATLALLLFHGAAELRPKDLRAEPVLTARLLLIALPLNVMLTLIVVRLVFPEIDAWLALVIASALASTDSALSTATVQNPVVPVRIRRLLSLESGLNDGIATPVVLFAISAAVGAANDRGALRAVLAIVIGIAFGTVVGRGVGRALRLARHLDWADNSLIPVAVLLIPLLCFYGADVLGGNGFMAAFVAGSTYATTHASRAEATSDLELTRLTSALLACAAWTMFAAASQVHLSSLVRWQTILIAVLSLTVLRIVPVAISLVGSGLPMPSVVFVGWFGPRGLPSVVFALIAHESLARQPGAATVVATIAATVILSVLAHGLTAPPMAERYGAWAGRSGPRAGTS